MNSFRFISKRWRAKTFELTYLKKGFGYEKN